MESFLSEATLTIYTVPPFWMFHPDRVSHPDTSLIQKGTMLEFIIGFPLLTSGRSPSPFVQCLRRRASSEEIVFPIAQHFFVLWSSEEIVLLWVSIFFATKFLQKFQKNSSSK
jgi:hypothetical protein